MSTNNKKYDLEDRLIEFAVLVITIAENLKIPELVIILLDK